MSHHQPARLILAVVLSLATVGSAALAQSVPQRLHDRLNRGVRGERLRPAGTADPASRLRFPRQPDLTVVSLKSGAQASPVTNTGWTSIVVEVLLQNRGSQSAAPVICEILQLDLMTGKLRLLKTRPLSPAPDMLRPGQSVALPFEVPVRANAQVHLVAQADRAGQVAELREDNNFSPPQAVIISGQVPR